MLQIRYWCAVLGIQSPDFIYGGRELLSRLATFAIISSPDDLKVEQRRVIVLIMINYGVMLSRDAKIQDLSLESCCNYSPFISSLLFLSTSFKI